MRTAQRDKFVTREDGLDAARGIIYTLIIVTPFWAGALWLWLR